jgi:serine/threonine-protein kinase HipA
VTIDKKLNVLYKGQLVGTLAQADYRTAFEYADNWIENGFSISPFSLPLEKKVFLPTKLHFQGLFGVFQQIRK